MQNSKWIGCARNNYRDNRPSHLEVEAVVIHIIDGSLAGADATFLDNNLDVPRSAHYGIGKDGRIHQYVQEKDTAFHAGVIKNPTWAGLKTNGTGGFINPNYYTIGIEHEGRANDEWPDALYRSSAELVKDISRRYPKLAVLSAANVVLHRQIRADKSCPGLKFQLSRLLTEVSGNPPAPVAVPLMITTRAAANLRNGRPSTSAPIVRQIPKDTLMHVVGSVDGDVVSGNSKWYQTLDTHYLWAGATDKPNP